MNTNVNANATSNRPPMALAALGDWGILCAVASSNSLVCTTVLLMKIICLCSYHCRGHRPTKLPTTGPHSANHAKLTDRQSDQHRPKTMPFVPTALPNCSLSICKVTFFLYIFCLCLNFIYIYCISFFVCLHIWHVTSVRFVKLCVLW